MLLAAEDSMDYFCRFSSLNMVIDFPVVQVDGDVVPGGVVDGDGVDHFVQGVQGCQGVGHVPHSLHHS